MITKMFAVCLLLALVSVPALAKTTNQNNDPNAIVSYANGNNLDANVSLVNENIDGNTDVNLVNDHNNGNTDVNLVNDHNNGNLAFVNMNSSNFANKVNPNN